MGKLCDVLSLLVLFFGFLVCIFQNIPERPADIGTPRKVRFLKEVWRDEAYGEMSEYAAFLKKNFFEKDFPGHLIRHPWPFFEDFKRDPRQTYVKEYDDNYYFLGGYIGWFLFPVKIERTNNYNYYLDEKEFKILKDFPSISVESQFIGSDVKKRFCLLKGLKPQDCKEWNLYFYPTKDILYVFILPAKGLKLSGIN